MAKFGHYNGAEHAPMQTYEDDFLKREGEYVTVMKSPKNGATVPEENRGHTPRCKSKR